MEVGAMVVLVAVTLSRLKRKYPVWLQKRTPVNPFFLQTFR